MSFLVKILGDPNDREVARHLSRVEEINAFEPEMEARADGDFLTLTQEFRTRIAEARGEDDPIVKDDNGDVDPEATTQERERLEQVVDEILDEILPEAFAAVREVSG